MVDAFAASDALFFPAREIIFRLPFGKYREKKLKSPKEIELFVTRSVMIKN